MNMISIENLTHSYGERKLFHHASFYLEDNEKVGIIGINGTGKSTLLKILAELEEADEGKVVKSNQMTTSYLPQNPMFPKEFTVIEAVKKHALEANNMSGESSFEKLEEIEVAAKSMLTKLGVFNFQQPCGELSGGQRKRLALVATLLSKADLLILDEPTNHLDNEMASWLEMELKKTKAALIMITHDRYFLDSVTNKIIEIDQGNIYSYPGNYSKYLELKTIREEMEEASFRKRNSLLRMEMEWVQRGARARSTKQKARLERYEELVNTTGPKRDGKVELSSVASRLGKSTIELNNISKAYGEQILMKEFSYIFLRDDRVGFIGKNGCGKSTLMKIIIGKENADEGTITIGQTVKISYYAQEIGHEVMDPNQRVIDYIKDTAEYIETPEGKITAAKMLERFLFEGEDQYSLLGKLSGGEKRRLYLAKILMESPNVLVLDEPTNDLDIATLQILENYLDTFQGIVIVVSHDRYFLDRTVKRIFAFMDKGEIFQSEGGYTDYENRLELVENDRNILGTKDDVGKKVDKTNWKEGQKKKLKMTYQEQRDFETIEKDMEKLEKDLEDCEEEIKKYVHDFVKLNEITSKKEGLENQLEDKMERWMYLEELDKKIKDTYLS